MAGTPIAILGGFSLTNAVVAAKESGGLWRDLAVAFFGGAVAFLLSALLFISIATRYTSSPGERLEWVPEAKMDAEKVENIRIFQRQDAWLLSKYFRSITLATTVGISGTLLGMAALLISYRRSWAVILTACLLLICAVLTISANFQWPKFLFPRPNDWKPDSPLSVLSAAEWDLIRK
ncbi:hypothetical protein ABZ281_17850 [Streptomyces sp. NPDC006265]|uniref:hypothetical protein n=1 Tax=Streptomyces sp. NPDC006265 TaxID=3156740 RepID=UPI0033AA29B9